VIFEIFKQKVGSLIRTSACPGITRTHTMTASNTQACDIVIFLQ